MEKEMKNRSNYSQEFKDQAVKLSYESGKTVAETAHNLGVAQSALYEWRAQAKGSTTAVPPPTVGNNGIAAGRTGGREEEIRTLREQLRIVTMERDILKKAIQVLGR
ncbi:MAG: transposase [Anaerolineae bacterium]|nr:transposase [Anaerolineae bacterium]